MGRKEKFLEERNSERGEKKMKGKRGDEDHEGDDDDVASKVGRL